MDMKVIQFKNKKLCERLEQRQTMEDELREKIEKLEKRQATDDTTLLIVNRYWSQVLLHLWLYSFKLITTHFVLKLIHINYKQEVTGVLCQSCQALT